MPLNGVHAARAITDCTSQGTAYALDSCGTGYMSQSYLRQLPVDTLSPTLASY
jgi:EAL domain-containing protein (putative c-di-GMP-specific phosphodiesterase class I)